MTKKKLQFWEAASLLATKKAKIKINNFFFENISNGAALKERSKKKFQTMFLLIIALPLLIHTFAILK